MSPVTNSFRGTVPPGPRPPLCRLGLHSWGAWGIHDLPCAGGTNVIEHAIRACTRCTQRDFRIVFAEE